MRRRSERKVTIAEQRAEHRAEQRTREKELQQEQTIKLADHYKAAE
jgi:hypothetical protein